jgi:hypothetical protein
MIFRVRAWEIIIYIELFKMHFDAIYRPCEGSDCFYVVGSVDRFCIDKSSSAELSETINSMYSWYQKARICYVYIADFPTTVPALIDSRWFTRGWSLQELIAPSTLIFYSGDWAELGTKLTLQDILAKRTGIDVGILTGEKSLESASVARRMSWACNRETTRTEDEAYCLMRIFDVNMSMLYGEGSQAFRRLQEEIMRHSDDQSLFAWTDSTPDSDSYHGLLAKSPKSFSNTGNIIPYRDLEFSATFSISNKGLRIDLHLSRYAEDLYICGSRLSSTARLRRLSGHLPQTRHHRKPPICSGQGSDSLSA